MDDCRSIDVNRLNREGCRRAGWMGAWQWMRDGEKVASIKLRGRSRLGALTYRVRVGESKIIACIPIYAGDPALSMMGFRS